MPLTQAKFNALVDDHSPALYRIAFRMLGDQYEAEDVVQDTFRSAWSSRDRFEHGRGDRAWLATILRRRVVDRWRRRQVPTVLAGERLLEVGVDGEDPLADDYSDQMQSALDRLSVELRESLLLVVVGELTHQEVADMLGIPLGTVLSRVSRARQRMRQFLLASTPP